MRPRDELDFIRDRVLAEIRANPSTEPLLGPKRSKRTQCRRGHTAWVVSGRGKRICRTCDVLRKRTSRQEVAG
jgi:hypothetical protein